MEAELWLGPDVGHWRTVSKARGFESVWVLHEVREPRLRSRGVGGVVGKLRRAKEEHDLGWQQSAANK